MDLPEEKKSLFKSIDLSFEYKGSTDLNQEVQPRSYKHSMGLSVSKDFWQKYTIALASGVDFTTLDGDVARASSEDDYYNLSDIGITAIGTFAKPGSIHSLSAIFSEDILVSEESRYRGYRSVTSGQLLLSSRVWSRVSFKTSVSGGYIQNRYRFSPITSGRTQRGDINPDGYYGVRFSPVIRLYKGLNFSASVGARGTHFLDGTNTYDFGNSYTLSYARDNWSIYGKYVNSGYADRGETNLWFVDQYRGLAELGLIYNF